MTRRAAGRTGKVLSLNQYVHRATLGLPKAERLDAAAELRAHLLERVTELEQKGFARDEAEFLAVQAMGDPQTTNRQLLGHFLTAPLGWVVLGAVLAGSVGWWANATLKPAEIRPSELRPTDFVAISHAMSWPLGWGSTFTRAADLRFPKGTTALTGALMTYGDKTLSSSSVLFALSDQIIPDGNLAQRELAQQSKNSTPRLQSPFRFIATAAPNITGTPCPEGKYELANLLYTTEKYRFSTVRQIGSDGITYADTLGGTWCTEDLGNSPEMNQTPFVLNEWTKLYQFSGTPKDKSNGELASYAFFLFPSDKAETPKLKPEQAYKFNELSRQWERK